jgi:hypothetical protein
MFIHPFAGFFTNLLTFWIALRNDRIYFASVTIVGTLLSIFTNHLPDIGLFLKMFYLADVNNTIENKGKHITDDKPPASISDGYKYDEPYEGDDGYNRQDEKKEESTDRKKEDAKDERKESREAKNQLDNLAKQGIQPSFSNAEAEAKSNALLIAANDCDFWGTGATQIMNTIYSVKNQADWYLLSSTFGVRSWGDCGTGEVSGSLTTLILEELDTTQMTEARRHLGQFGISL